MSRGDLQGLFERGALVRPSQQQPNVVHVIRALAMLAGVEDIEIDACSRRLIELIGPAPHLVFVLVDGLGMNIVRRLSAESFVARHLRMELQATCPSTTACALTSVATAAYPSRSGVVGWFTYVPELNLTMTVLPFAERFSNQSLTHRGLRPQDVFPLRSICPRMTHAPLTLVPAYIANTAFNVYSRGGTTGVGYLTLEHAVDEILRHASQGARDGQPTYSHLYLHDIDTLCHHVGVDHPNVLPPVMKIDAELARLAEALRPLGGRMVVVADHGLIDVPESEQTLLQADDPLLVECLRVPPTGDARMPIFHVRADRHNAFVGQFRQRFSDRMLLLPTADAEEMELFGPGEMSPISRARFGDYIGIAFRPATLAYHSPGRPVGTLYKAVHAGLSPEEMIVPLCISS